MKKFLLIDGNAIFYRAFHALPLLKTDSGECTNAIMGFLKMFFDIVEKINPHSVAIAFDHHEKTFRHHELKQYKAHRPPPPDELYPQLPRLFELLKALRVSVFQEAGYEADDIIGTLTKKAELIQDMQIIILTGDKDAFQLVNEKTFVATPVKGISEIEIYDMQKVFEKMGVWPNQIIDYKALRGDASDNIPGVKGIGEKQAVSLLNKYETLEKIYEKISELADSQRNKLENNKEMAFLSKKMATIVTNMPITLDMDKCCFLQKPNIDIEELFDVLRFKNLKNKLKKFISYIEQKSIKENQATLF